MLNKQETKQTDQNTSLSEYVSNEVIIFILFTLIIGVAFAGITSTQTKLAIEDLSAKATALTQELQGKDKTIQDYEERMQSLEERISALENEMAQQQDEEEVIIGDDWERDISEPQKPSAKVKEVI